MTFGNKLLLAGILLVLVPIIIHILNRMRYKIVEWAAMDFLFQAYKEERRRVNLEHLILLALRCLAVALLAFAVADPAIRYAGLGGAGGQPTERIVLLDDTYSMGHGPRTDSAFTKARVEIERLIDSLADSRSRDTVTLVLASRPAKPVFSDMALTNENLAIFKETLRGLQPSDRARPAKEYLAEFHDAVIAGGEGTTRAVYYFSDFRQVDWKPEEWSSVSNPGSVPGLAADTRWILADVGEDDPANLSIVGIEARPREVVAGIEFDLVVSVANRGDHPSDEVTVSVLVGDEVQRDLKIGSIDPGRTIEARIPLTISSPGEVQIVARIPPDPLAADNVHYGRVLVLEDHALLLVDQDPPGYGWARETFFLARALAPPGAQRSGIAPRVIGFDQFRDVKSLDDYSIVYLCNLPPLAPARVEDLEGYVSRGGAVVFFLGTEVNPGDYNRAYFRDGAGLLPYLLADPKDLAPAEGTEKPAANLDPDVESHPILAPFASGASEFLTEIRIFRAFGVQVPETPPPGSSVVLRASDSQRTVIVAEKAFGKGRVFLFTTTADRGALSMAEPGWNDWYAGPGYLVFHQVLVNYLLSLRPIEPPRRPGATIRFPLDSSKFDRTVRFTPHAESESAESYEEPAAGEVEGLWVEFDKTERTGLYRFDLASKTGGDPVSRFVSISLDPRDGDLQKAGQDAVEREIESAAQAAGLEVPEVAYYEIFRASGSADWLAFLEEKTRIWQWLLAALLGLLLVESLYAWRIGNR